MSESSSRRDNARRAPLDVQASKPSLTAADLAAQNAYRVPHSDASTARHAKRLQDAAAELGFSMEHNADAVGEGGWEQMSPMERWQSSKDFYEKLMNGDRNIHHSDWTEL